MAYADLQADAAYRAKQPGAGVAVVIVDAADPSLTVLGAATSFNYNDNFETIPVEEAGLDGVDEHIQGRHDGAGNIGAFFTPEWSDNLPSRDDFIGREFTIFQRIASKRPFEGSILNVFIGCRMNRVAGAQAARGNLTIDMGFVYQKRYTGEQWAAISGS